MPIKWKPGSSRIIIGLVLLVILIILCEYHYTNFEEHLEYPSTKMIHQDPEYYDGQIISEGGTVSKVCDSFFVITSMDRDVRYDFVIATKDRVYLGDHVEVLGTFQAPNRITPDKMIVTPALSGKMVYVRSLIGLLILVIVFFRSWKFDLRRFVFISRRV